MNARARSLVSTICFIHLGGLPHERSVFFDENTEGGGGGGGGGSSNTEKKLEFTQAQLDSMFAERTKKANAENAELKAKLDALAKTQAELQAKADELELKGKSAEEKARIAADKAAQKIEADKAAALKEAADAKAIADAATKQLRAHVIGSQVSEALVAGKVLTGSLRHAVPAFLADVEIDTDETTHKITAVRLGGVAQKDIATAAAEWLKSNPHFAAAAQGGTGSRGQGGGTNGRPLHELSVDELVVIANRERASGAR